MEFLKDLWLFLKERKKWWLIPVIVVLLLIGLIIVLGGSSAQRHSFIPCFEISAKGQNMTREKNLEAILTITTGFLLLYLVFKIKTLLLIALLIGIIGLFSKSLAAGISWLWYKLAEILGLVIPRILLCIVFYLLLFPLALLSRLFDKDPLRLSRKHTSFYAARNIAFEKSNLEKPW